MLSIMLPKFTMLCINGTTVNGGVLSISGLLMVIACIATYFSPLGKIGGANAKPILSFKNWLQSL
ncbi:hypothetical protein [Peribacillus butanolivorans]|uniref:hypothetical protein n=1 Tax=Peribacillus butanolivorans TaxID=421767 RepID=UPI0036A46C86